MTIKNRIDNDIRQDERSKCVEEVRDTISDWHSLKNTRWNDKGDKKTFWIEGEKQ